jgi:thiamine-phosphate pyrophosphorylase
LTTSHDYTLCFVTDKTLSNGRSTPDVVRLALRGGATIIQLRDKGRSRDYLLRTGAVIRDLCREYGASFVVNDSVDIAGELGADGVHLGQGDMSAIEARRILGDDAIVGISVSSTGEALKAESEDASYVGAGPVFATGSKPDAIAPIHLSGIESIVKSVRIPVMAIGGISIHNASEVAATGAHGIAVISAISAADDPEEAANRLHSCFTANR